MTQKDINFTTRDDDRELNEYLEITHNKMIFENCTFSLCTNKQFSGCIFTNCIFEHVTKETHFTQCSFEAPTFYSGFHGQLENCVITKYTGLIGELKEKRA